MPIWVWASFIVFVLVMLAIDLCVINRKAHVIRSGEALRWTGVTVVLALLFSVVVFYLYKHGYHGNPLNITDALDATDRSRLAWKATTEYLTGWILEYSLSMDNVFVILLIFRHFRVPQEFQHRVLFWGILGALVMRGLMIVAASELITHFQWTIYLFGAFLVYTAIKLLFASAEGVDPEKSLVVRMARKIIPVAPTYHGTKFFTRIDGVLVATPLFLVLLVVESTDLIFAVDSIPAIFGITKDPFLVFTSNVFAIIGLRSLYFALAAVMDNFRYLKTSLVFVLGFIGVKMMIEGMVHIPVTVSLSVILGILGVGVMASIFATKRERAMKGKQSPVDDLGEAATIAYRKGRKLVILVIGLTLLAVSIPIGLLPGPGGIAVAIGGLALLATEFVWARSLLRRLKEQTQKFAAKADAMISKKPRPWLIPPVVGGFATLIWLGVENAPYGPYKPVSWLGNIGPFEHKHVYFAAAGPAIAIAFWSYMTIKRWLQHRTAGPYAKVPEKSPVEGEGATTHTVVHVKQPGEE